jgi:hypothetical protein
VFNVAVFFLLLFVMLVMYPAGDEEDVEFVITHKGSQKWEAKLLQTLDA